MAIKQIQLRGISRTPSDRMTADGGCAESINVHIEGDELAPTLYPKQVLGLNCGVTKELVYVHKTPSYENYIYLNNGTSFYQNSDSTPFLTIGSNENFKEIQTIGNTLMALTDERMFYVLYKDGGYKLLGEQIPEPQINIGIKYAEEGKGKRDIANDKFRNETEYFSQYGFFGEENRSKNDVDANEDMRSFVDALESDIRKSFGEAKDNNLYAGYLTCPIFVRYAIRLYDGTYIRHSAPILLDPYSASFIGGLFDTMQIFFKQDYSGNTSAGYKLEGKLKPYNLSIGVVNKSAFDGWEDIVAGVDLFASPQIDVTDFSFLSSKAVKYEFNSGGSLNADFEGALNWKYFGIEEAQGLLSYSNFYRIKKWNIDEYKNPSLTHEIEDYAEAFGDNLLNQKRLPIDMFTNDKHIPEDIHVYNNRLLLVGTKTRLYDGSYNLPSTTKDATRYDTKYYYYIKYFIRTDNGADNVVGREYYSASAPSEMKLDEWLYYPNPRCYKALVQYGEYISLSRELGTPTFYKMEVPMREHPNLNGAYAYNAGSDREEITSFDTEDNPIEPRSNRVYQSEINNPFVYMAEQSFPGSLIGLAPVTHAISTGQFGYASLYAFTSEGIWTIKSTADGSLGAYDYLSADIALPGTVCPIEQAIVFSTSKGVMLLQGGEIISLSPNMNGKPYVMEGSVKEVLQSSAWSRLSQFNDGVIFMHFMSDARPLYDYRGQRIIFFNSSKDYAYTYYLNTATWHKIAMNTDVKFSRVLGNYPDAWISAKSGGYIVYDYSTNLSEIEDEETRPNAAPGAFDIKSMIVTRTFDLDAPDVRKSIKSIRVRGIKNAEDVKYILLGSMDGLSFGIVRSLRGASYKFYRLILLLSLSPTERVSWVDIDYETRFAKRLR